MFQEIINSSLRTLLSYFLLLVLTRFMGRKLISQMTFFDFVVGIVIGSVGANLAVNQARQVISGSTVAIVISLLVVIIDLINIKNFRINKLTDAEPIFAVAKGQIIEQNLRRIRCTVDQLMMLLREKNAFNIADVEYAVFETDGKLSVLKKSHKQPATPSDLNITPPYKGLTKDIILDGRIMTENLRDAGLEEADLMKMLSANDVVDTKEVFYAGLDSNGFLYVSKKSAKTEGHGKYGIE
jgi:uncharacterized membrane protein YcaP (DUF421 family)